MTTTVKRGAGRPAATARTAKAAQRTSLPAEPAKETPREEFNRLTALPLSEQTRSIKTRIRKLANLPENTGPREEEAAQAEMEQADRAMGPEMPKPAPKRPARRATKATPGKAPDVWLADVVKTEPAAKPARSTRKAAAAIAPAKTPAPAGKTATRAESHPERREGSGPAKLARMTAELEPLGWKITAKTTGNRIEATAKRGTETLRQVWVDGAYDYGASIYKDGGSVTRKVRNLSEATRLAARKAEEA